MQRVAQRDHEVFTQLYDVHLNPINRYILYKVGDQILAEELTAEVFARAWGSVDRFHWRDIPFEHWLLRIARNVVIDHWRAHRSQTMPIEALNNAASEEVSPEQQLDRDVKIVLLQKALAGLPDDQRDVLILRFIEGYSHADVASALGKSVVAVRQIQVRGLRAVGKLLHSEDEFVELAKRAKNVTSQTSP